MVHTSQHSSTSPHPTSDLEKAAHADHDEYSHPSHSPSHSNDPKYCQREDEDQQPIPWTPTRMIAIAALCIVYVGSQIILYFVSSGLTYISRTLDTSIGNWMLTANTLAVAAICPFVGYLTDLLGRRWITIAGAGLLVLASIVMATAGSLGQAVAAQAVGGVGAGVCELTALAGVAEITPARWRGVTLSLVTFSIIPFMPQVLYTILVNRAATWRYLFLITGLWNFFGALGLFICYHPPPRPEASKLTLNQLLRRIDYIGALLSIGGITLFLVGLQAGGYQFPWSSGKVLGPLIVGPIMLIAFPFWEWLGPHEYPMVPRDLFKGQRVVGLAYILVFVAGMDFYSILGFFPVVLQSVYHSDEITIGVRALNYPWAILGGACIVSWLMSYTRGHVREMFFVCAAMMTAFTGALAHSNPNNFAFTEVISTFAAFGNGAVVVPALTLALYASPDQYIGTTGALSLSARFLGGSVGTAIYFNVFNTRIQEKLPAYVGKAAVGAGLAEAQVMDFIVALTGPDPSSAAQVQGATPQVLQAAQYASQWAFADSLKYVWYVTIPFGTIATVCCLFLPNIRRFMTDRVAVDIH